MKPLYKTSIYIFRFGIVAIALLSIVSLLRTKSSESQYCDARNNLAIPSVSTIDPRWQKTLSTSLSETMAKTKSVRGLSIAIDIETGETKSLVSINNKPRHSDCGGLRNLAVTAWEPGSVVKPLLAATAIQEGRVEPTTQLFVRGQEKLSDNTITNTLLFRDMPISVNSIINKSINTGMIAILRSLGNKGIDVQAKKLWYRYLTEKFRFAEVSNFGLQGEDSGYIRPPTGGRNLEYRYASMSFGIGMTATPVQLINAYRSVLNGEKQFPVSHIDSSKAKEMLPVSVSSATSQKMTTILEQTFARRNENFPESYIVGGKTGTASLPDGTGTYMQGIDHESGTFIGFIGKERPKYIILVMLHEPDTTDYASTQAVGGWIAATRALIDLKLID